MSLPTAFRSVSVGGNWHDPIAAVHMKIKRQRAIQKPMAIRQRNRRGISLLLVFVMLCAQLILAHHATVHFIEDEHIGVAYQHENKQESPVDHPAQDKDKICQICLYSKALSYTFLCAGVDVHAPVFTIAFAVPVPQDSYARLIAFSLRARGPPSSLS